MSCHFYAFTRYVRAVVTVMIKVTWSKVTRSRSKVTRSRSKVTRSKSKVTKSIGTWYFYDRNSNETIWYYTESEASHFPQMNSLTLWPWPCEFWPWTCELWPWPCDLWTCDLWQPSIFVLSSLFSLTFSFCVWPDLTISLLNPECPPVVWCRGRLDLTRNGSF